MKWPACKIIFLGLVVLVLVGFGVFAVWRIWLAHDINKLFAEIHSHGLPTNGAEANEYYSAVPDDENAAIKMAKAFGVLTNYDDSRSNRVGAIKFLSREKSLTPEQLNLVAGYWAMNTNALALAREAIKQPRSRYPIDLTLGAETLLPHLPKLKNLSQLAVFQSYIKPEDSADAVKVILGMAHTLDREPVLISKLVRIALINEAVSVCQRRLNSGGADAEELWDLEKLFDAASATNQVASGLVGERAMYVRCFRMSWADIKRYSNDAGDDSSSSSRMPDSPSEPFITRFSGFFERDLRFYLQAMDTNIVLAQTFPKNIPAISKVQDKMEQESRRNFYILSSLFLPALENTIIREATGLAEVRLAQIALAVERFRLANQRLPENLNQLVPQFLPAVPQDPCDGQPLRFRLLTKGYLIYSVGKDGQDHGGRERPDDAKSSDRTPYDITFTIER